MSSLRGDREEESREIKAVELVDLSPMAQRAPSDAIHQSAPRLSHLDWGPCGANPKCNQGLLPSAASGCWLHLPRTCAFVMPQLESQQHQPPTSRQPALPQMSCCLVACSFVVRNDQSHFTRPRPATRILSQRLTVVLGNKPVTKQIQTLVAGSRVDCLLLTLAPSHGSKKGTSADHPLATTHAS